MSKTQYSHSLIQLIQLLVDDNLLIDRKLVEETKSYHTPEFVQKGLQMLNAVREEHRIKCIHPSNMHTTIVYCIAELCLCVCVCVCVCL